MRKLYCLLVSLLAVALGPAAQAQLSQTQSTPVTQSAVHNDAAAFWIGQANGATSCNSVSQTAAQDTITITPGPGQTVHLTNLIVQMWQDATGFTAVPTISITGISNPGGAAAPFMSAASTLATAVGFLTPTPTVIPFPQGGLLGNGPGTAVTIVPSATLGAHNYLCMSAVGYFF